MLEQNANESQIELYTIADPDPEAHLEQSYTSYINPENYTSTADGQHSTRIALGSLPFYACSVFLDSIQLKFHLSAIMKSC